MIEISLVSCENQSSKKMCRVIMQDIKGKQHVEKPRLCKVLTQISWDLFRQQYKLHRKVIKQPTCNQENQEQ